MVWQDFVGKQIEWPVSQQAFASKVDRFPVCDLGQLPSDHYEVVGMITAGKAVTGEPMSEVLKEAVQFGKEHGATALVEKENKSVQNLPGRMPLYHQWYAVKFITESTVPAPGASAQPFVQWTNSHPRLRSRSCAIPTVSHKSERALETIGETLTRITPREDAISSGQIGLPFGAADGIQRISDCAGNFAGERKLLPKG